MRFVSLVVEPLWRNGTQGKLLVGLLALLVCVAFASLVIGFVPRSRTVTRYFMGLVALVALGAFAATRNFVAAGRAVVLELALDASLARTNADVAIFATHAGMLLAGIAFAVSALVVIAPLWRSDLRRASRLAASAACGLVALASAFIVTYVDRSHTPFHFCEGQDPPRCWLEHLESLRTITDTGSAVVLAFGVAVLVAAVFFALRPELEQLAAGKGLFSTGVAMLALGGAAFAATRGMARDAHHLLSVPKGIGCYDWLPNPPALPRARAKCEPVEAPLVSCTASATSIDAVSVNQVELEKTLRAKRELWTTLNPYRAFPARVIVLAQEDLSGPLFAPALTAARRAGYSHIGVLAQEPQPGVTTATLGVVPRRGYCCATFFDLDPSGRPIESFATWREVHDIAAREAKLKVSVP